MPTIPLIFRKEREKKTFSKSYESEKYKEFKTKTVLINITFTKRRNKLEVRKTQY